MQYLKRSTTINIKLGPFLDRLDGYTEETGLTPAVEISKNGGAFASRNSATAVAHDAEGWYTVELDATDTNTLGRLVVKAQDNSTHLPVWQEYSVLMENVYNSLFSTGRLEVETVEISTNAQGRVWTYGSRGLTNGVDIFSISGDSTAADNAELFFDNTGFNASNSTIGTVTNLTEEISGGTSSGATPAQIWAYGIRTLSSGVDIISISGDTVAADNAELFFDNNGFNASNSTIGTVTTVTNAVTVTGTPAVNATQISGSSIAADAAENFFTNAGFNGSNITIGYVTHVGNLLNPVNLQTATQASIDAIEADTNEIQGKLPTGDIADESNVETHLTNSLNTYDPPTRTEATADKDAIIAEVQGISAGSGATPAQIWTYGIRSLTEGVDIFSVSGNVQTAENLVSMFNPYGYVKVSFWQFKDQDVDLVSTIDANLTRIKGNTSTVDNLEDDYDGTGYDKTNSTINLSDTTEAQIDAIDASVTTIQGKLPTDYSVPDVYAIWGYVSRTLTASSGVSAETEAQIDAIETAVNKLDDTVENDGGTYRFTTNALEQAPSGTVNITSVDVQSIAGYTVTKNTGQNMINYFDVLNPSTSQDVSSIKKIIQARGGD